MFLYRLLADLVVVLHLAFVLFVVLGMAAILLGMALKWQWVRNFWFRIVHLLMIATVVEKSLFGVTCPLTDWEDMLREKAGEAVQQGTFIGRILDRLLFWQFSDMTFMIVYSLFGLAVLLAFIFAPPRLPRRKNNQR